MALRPLAEEDDQPLKDIKMTPLKVLHVGKFLPPPYAGIEAHIEQLLPALRPDVECGLLVSELGWQHRPYTPRDFAVHPVRTLATAASTALSPTMPWEMRRLVREHGYQLVHLHLPNPMADMSSWWLPDDVPIVLTWHSDIVRQKKLLKLYWPMLRRLIERVDRIIAFTPKHFESSEQLRRAGAPAQFRVVPVAIDPTRFAKTRIVDDAMQRWRRQLGVRPIVLTVGRHVYYKGYQFLIEAMAEVRSDAVLVMVGTGPLTAQLRATASALGIDNRVVFAGSVADIDVAALMHLCDVFCLPSVEPSEAFGLSSAEAMQCGKPVVVCELGNGVNYLNQQGITGLTVPPRDSSALAQALNILVCDEDIRFRLGEGAQRWIEKEFSIEKMRRGTINVYEELLRA
jgi:glycosyltransferase involved in cell wall biosynthesis